MLLLVCWFVLPMAVWAQNDSVPAVEADVPIVKYMDIPGPGNSQGGDCYGKYLFVVAQGGHGASVYDLEEKKKVGGLWLECDYPPTHANTVNFGTQFYREGDEFPLLYVSANVHPTGNDWLGYVYAYRITKSMTDDGQPKFRSELVQTITLEGFFYHTEFILDNSDGTCWVRGHYYLSGYEYRKYAVPDAHQARVTLRRDDPCVLDSIKEEKIKAIDCKQGAICRDGYIYYPTGLPSQTPYLVGISTERHDIEYIINLHEAQDLTPVLLRGNKYEMEFICKYKGEYFLGTRGYLFRVDMDRLHQCNYFFNRYRLMRTKL